MGKYRRLEKLLGLALMDGECTSPSTEQACPCFDSLAAYAEGRMDGLELDQFRIHLAQCAECRMTLAAVNASEAGPMEVVPADWINRAKQAGPAPQEEPSPRPFRSRSWFSWPRLFPTGAGALAAVAGIMLLVWGQPDITDTVAPVHKSERPAAALETSKPAPAKPRLQTLYRSPASPVRGPDAKMARHHPSGAQVESLENALATAWSQVQSLGRSTGQALGSDPRLAERIARLESALVALVDSESVLGSSASSPSRAMPQAPSPAPPGGNMVQPQTSAPGQTGLKLGGIEVDGDYDMMIIHQRLTLLRERINNCDKGYSSRRRLRVGFIISPGGGLSPASSWGPGQRLQGCLLSLLGEAPLPPPPNGGRVQISLIFSSSP